MNESPSGLLPFVLIFAAVLLFNYATRRIEAWRKQQKQLPPPDKPPARMRQATETIRRVRRAAASGSTVGEPEVFVHHFRSRVASPTTRTAVDARALVTGRRNLRRAVIAMAVLGPCKSQEPP